MLALLGTPGFEPALRAEINRDRSPIPCAWPGVVLCEPGEGAAPVDPVFARQQLPAAVIVQGTSVARLARAAFDAIEAAVDAHAGPLTLHATTPAMEEYGAIVGRAALLGKELLGLFYERRRRAWRRFVPHPGTDTTVSAGVPFMVVQVVQVVQVVLVERDQALVSASIPRAYKTGGSDISPWPGGAAPVADDRRPPSRAYRKLEEAFLWIGAAPGVESACVDLGGAPGGWSWSALDRGARVVAVDRAPLAASVARHPHLTAKIGNAFTYEPDHPVDWLLCDVICEPQRTIALVERWLERAWCRNVIASVKFRGHADYGLLGRLPGMLARTGCRFARTKHLVHNRNEVTIMARR